MGLPEEARLAAMARAPGVHQYPRNGTPDLTAALEDAVLLLGDPMYRAVALAEAEFLEQPYFALSGRLYLSRVADCFADS